MACFTKFKIHSKILSSLWQYIYQLMAYEILYLKVYFVFKRSSAIFHILQGYFCPLIWDSIFKTANTIWNILGSAYWLQSMQKIILGTFVYLFIPKIYSVKTKFSVLQTVQLRCYTFHWLTSQFCIFFLAVIFL